MGLGVVGALVDLALHFLQLINPELVSPRGTALITIGGCALLGLSLLGGFNAGALVLAISVGGMGVYSLATGKEVH
jgi:hypothetical protein